MPARPQLGESRVSFKVTVALVILALSAALITVYFVFPLFRSHLVFIAAVIGGAGAIYGGYYTGLTVKQLRHQELKNRSFELVRRLDDIATISQRKRLESEIKVGGSSDQHVYSTIQGDKELLGIATMLLNYFEDLAIAVQEDFVDERIMFRSLRWIACSTNERLGPYVRELRRMQSTPTFYIQFDRLVKRWSEAKALSSEDALNH